MSISGSGAEWGVFVKGIMSMSFSESPEPKVMYEFQAIYMVNTIIGITYQKTFTATPLIASNPNIGGPSITFNMSWSGTTLQYTWTETGNLNILYDWQCTMDILTHQNRLHIYYNDFSHPPTVVNVTTYKTI